MLQTAVYSESTVRLNDITTRIGEDALPFLSSMGMFVADGLGGSAGVRIHRFDPDCFDADRLEEKLVSSVGAQLTQENMAVLRDYIRKSFSSLTAKEVKLLYSDPDANLLRLKKSGYVGSHALGLVLAGILLKMEELGAHLSDPSEWEACVHLAKDALYAQYCSVIDALGAKAAEVKLSKVRYFGTTLSAAFFHENEDSVDVIFLNCGDSRSYVWDADGFRQAAEDQGRNGGMTSVFYRKEADPNSDQHIEISVETKHYKKPCAVLCMTDGVYGTFGAGSFASSPLYMEGYLMNTLLSSATLEEAAQNVKRMLDVKGRIDDCNSMAVTFFGFDDYEQIRAAAAARMETITTAYLQGKPKDFLTVDYSKKLQKLQERAAEQIDPLLQSAFDLPIIRLYCAKRLSSPVNAKYCRELHSIHERTQSLTQKNLTVSGELCRLASDNFTDFVDVDDAADKGFLQKTFDKLLKTPKERAAAAGDLFNQCLTDRDEAVMTFEKLAVGLSRKLCTSADDMYIDCADVTAAQLRDMTLSRSSEAEGILRQYCDQLSACLADIRENARNLPRLVEQWQTENKKAQIAYAENGGIHTARSVAEGWLAAARDIETTLPSTTIPAVRQQILCRVHEYEENDAALRGLTAEYAAAGTRAAKRYWEENAKKEIGFVLDGNLLEEKPALKSEIERKLAEDKELVRVRELSAAQTSVFRHYLDLHLSEVSESKRADVETNGWK